jgi:hypothetical protein
LALTYRVKNMLCPTFCKSNWKFLCYFIMAFCIARIL